MVLKTVNKRCFNLRTDFTGLQFVAWLRLRQLSFDARRRTRDKPMSVHMLKMTLPYGQVAGRSRVAAAAAGVKHLRMMGGMMGRPKPEPAGPGQESVWEYPRPAVAEARSFAGRAI